MCVELLPETFASGLAETSAESRVAQQSENLPGELFHFLRRQEHPRLIRDDHFSCTVHVVADDGNAAEECLWQDACEPFPQGSVDEEVHRVNGGGDLLGRDESDEDDAPGESAFPDAAFVFDAPPAVADQQELRARLDPRHFLECVKEEHVTLEVAEPCDLADDQILPRQPISVAHFRAVVLFQEA